jgi:hypothetical protein
MHIAFNHADLDIALLIGFGNFHDKPGATNASNWITV